MLPESQLVLDDLWAEMYERLGELVEGALTTGELAWTDAVLMDREREFVWEFLARTLLLCQSVPGTAQNPAPTANKVES